jgi:hypothetical protein
VLGPCRGFRRSESRGLTHIRLPDTRNREMPFEDMCVVTRHGHVEKGLCLTLVHAGRIL